MSPFYSLIYNNTEWTVDILALVHTSNFKGTIPAIDWGVNWPCLIGRKPIICSPIGQLHCDVKIMIKHRW